MDDVQRAADAIRAGEAVVYPTETVYGLGADASDAAAVERVFEIKGRSRDKPLSVAFPSVDAALAVVEPTDRAARFARAFLPGPVTVILGGSPFPEVLTAGSDRVGVRVPTDETARELARRAGPITATSANRSGTGSVRRVEALADEVLDAVGAVVDRGETPGGQGSTVVDPARGEIHRFGPEGDAIRTWLEEH